MDWLFTEIEKDEETKLNYLKLTFLQTIDLAVGTSETIPIDLFTWVYWSDKDLEIVKKSTGENTESDWETIEETEKSEPTEAEIV